MATWLYVLLFVSALGAQPDLYMEYPRPAWLDPVVEWYALRLPERGSAECGCRGLLYTC